MQLDMVVESIARVISNRPLNTLSLFLSTAFPSATGGVFSHSPTTPLPEALTITFNPNLKRIKEDVHYVYIRVQKNPLTTEERDNVREKYPGNGSITLQLLVKINTTSDSRGVYSLLSKAVIQRNEIGQQKYIEFSKITEDLVTDAAPTISAKSPKDIETRLIISGDCYNRISPDDLGFNENSTSFIMVFAKSDDSEEAILRAGFAELAAEASAVRNKRNTDTTFEDSSTDDRVVSRQNSTNSTEQHPEAYNASTAHIRSCRRYSHQVKPCCTIQTSIFPHTVYCR